MPRNTSPYILGDYWLDRAPNSPYWSASWYERETRRVRFASLRTRSLEEAKLALAQWVISNVDLQDEAAHDVPIASVVQRYYAQRGKSLASHEVSKRAVNLWCEYWGDDSIRQMHPAKIEAFVVWLRSIRYAGKRVSESYVRRLLSVGKAALNRAYQRQEIDWVPYISLRGLDLGADFEHVATIEQIASFFNAITPDMDHVYIYTLIRLNTVCRGDAVLDLGPAQINWQDGLVALNPPGRKQTKKYRPVVPLTPSLRAVLEPLRQQATFVEWKGRPLKSIRSGWNKVRDSAGLPSWFIPKICRHTLATRLRQAGVPGWEVSGLMGHRGGGQSHRTTERYAKYAPGFHAASVREIERIMDRLAAKVPRLLESCSRVAGVTNEPGFFENHQP